MKNNKTILWLVAIIAILALIKILFLSPKTESPGGVGQKAGKTPPSVVNVFVVVPQELNNKVFATGTIIANEEAILMPEISGKVILMNIKEGSVVNKGDLLVKINDADFQAQLKKLELQVKIAEDRVDREKQLLAIKGVSQEEYDINLNLLNTAKADIEYVKAQIAKTEIRAPFSGVIGLKYISEGSYISSASHIASIQQMNPVKIDFSVPEKYANALQLGDIMEFTVPENNQTFKAKLYAIEPKIDMNTRTIQLRAITDNNKNELFPGAFAKIVLPIRKITGAIMIPTEAIIPVLKGKKVFVCKDGKAKAVNVETGIRTDALIQVTAGLQAGDSVITTGIMQLKADSPVKVIKK